MFQYVLTSGVVVVVVVAMTQLVAVTVAVLDFP
jgi:hypothetical protein